MQACCIHGSDTSDYSTGCGQDSAPEKPPKSGADEQSVLRAFYLVTQSILVSTLAVTAYERFSQASMVRQVSTSAVTSSKYNNLSKRWAILV
jgi:hypothetical protein